MQAADPVGPGDVVAFWRAAGGPKWFRQSDEFDAEIRAKFLATHESAAAGALADWESTAEGALALLILLDQFSRNLFRGTPRAYAADPLAREVARRAIGRGFDAQVSMGLRTFFYLPFMHSEDLADHARCVELYRALGDPEGLRYAEHHADLIRRFGRFPHRNRVLGRATTADEQAFLDAGGFSG